MSSYSFTIPVAPFSDDAVIPRTSTGIIIPKLATYVMRVDGVVIASPNTANPCGVGDLPTLTFGEGFDTDWLRPTINSWTPSATRWVSDTIPPGREQEIFVSRGGYGAAVGCNAPDGSRIGGPLYVLSSSQTLTVDVIKIGTFKLGVTPQLANPVPKDTTIIFIEKNDGDTQDDFVKDSWKWAPADGSPPVELWPNTCGFTCRFRVTQSGTMTLSGTVGGFLDGHRERVSATSTVTVAGDPQIALTVSPDTVEQGDTILVKTTITGATKDSILGYSAGSIVASRTPSTPNLRLARAAANGTLAASGMTATGGALRTVSSVSVPSCLGTTPAVKECFIVATGLGKLPIRVQAVADGKPLDASKDVYVLASPKLDVRCTTPTRGDDVVCSATVTAGDPSTDPAFVVLRQTAKGKRFSVNESPNASVGGGKTYEWKGPAVAKTDVTFEVQFDDRGKTKQDRKTATFDPSSRGWQEFKLKNAGVLKKALGPRMVSELSNGAFGVFEMTDPTILASLATTARGGPNDGLSYFVNPIPFVDASESYVHPGLYGGIGGIGVEWYNDQNGKPSGTCTAKEVDALRGMAEIHEGSTADKLSHWQIANDALAAAKLQETFEATYVQGTTTQAAELGDKIYFAWKAGDYATRQNKFDATDKKRIFDSLKCKIDYNLSDN